MDLIAVSYQNIWPFQDKQFSIFFSKWKYLVNAPIGFGKSFLFFDWPIYGLYKYGKRKLLNSKAKDGYIKLIFKTFDNYYLVVRNLKQWKTKDSCGSLFYELPNFSEEDLQKEFSNGQIMHDFDIQEFITKNPANIQLQNFKNERDLDEYLSQFIIPKEVFLSTVFLMQDSDNIFQLAPSERIKILKNMFGLTFLDEAKDIILDKKRTLTTQIKLLSNNDDINNKLQSNISIILNQLSLLSENDDLKNIISKNKETIEELEFAKDKIAITSFELPEQLFSLSEQIGNHIDQQKTELIKLESKHQDTQKNLDTLKTELSQSQQQIDTKNSELSQLKSIITNIDETKLEKLKIEKQTYYQQIQEQSNILSTVKHNLLENSHTLDEANDIINNLINDWKNKKQQKENIESMKKLEETNITNLQDKITHLDTTNQQLYKQELESKKQNFQSQIQTINLQTTNLQEKQKSHQEEVSKIDEKINKFKWFLDEQSTFNCEKIEWNCPFVKVIKKDSFQKFESELESLNQEKATKLQTYTSSNIELQLQEKQTALLELNKNLQLLEQTPKELMKDFFENLEWQKQNLQAELTNKKEELKSKKFDQQIKDLEAELLDISKFFHTVPRKQIQENYQKTKDLQALISKLDQSIQQLEQEIAKLENYKLQIQTIQTQIIQLQTQLEEKKTKQTQITEELKEQSEQLSTTDKAKINSLSSSKDKISETLSIIKSQITDFKTQQLTLNQKKEDEKIVSNLHQIFSKEILLYVLDENLPVLNDTINNFLSQIVDFQVDMRLETTGDKLELQTIIYKQDQEIEVQSLSWWQRVILKLIWMLAISSYNRASMLFLDETINNLDEDTVSKVSSVIENFIKQQNLKMYVVTHSKQIQQMNIWDGEISKI